MEKAIQEGDPVNRELIEEDEEWLMRTMDRRGQMPLRDLWLLWARERGSADNIVVWPLLHVGRALRGLKERGILVVDGPQKSGGSAA